MSIEELAGYNVELVELEELKGQILTSVDVEKDGICFCTTHGKKYYLYHQQDCCEVVNIESVDGDVENLTNEPIIVALERSVEDSNAKIDSGTYQWYVFATLKGTVVIRFHGTSNGCYGETASLFTIK